jgi:hypothetical protein
MAVSELNKRFQLAFIDELKARGFRKTGPTWRKSWGDAITVFNLQGSQFGPSVYVNLGVYFCPLGELERPNEYQCHLRARLSMLVPDADRLRDLLDLDRPIPDDVRFTELRHLAVDYALPWLERTATREGAKAWVTAGPNAFVHVKAREYLGVPVGT